MFLNISTLLLIILKDSLAQNLKKKKKEVPGSNLPLQLSN